MIKTQITKDGVWVSMPYNMTEATFSHSGKSFVYRVKGTYLDSKGNIKGEEGQRSPYLYKKLPFKVKWPYGKYFLKPQDFIEHDFDGMIIKGFKFEKA